MKSPGGSLRLGIAAVLLTGLLGCSGTPIGPQADSLAPSAFQGGSGERASGIPVSLSGNFNGTPIAKGRVIWFTGVLGYSGPTTFPVTFHLDESTIQFTANGVPYTLPVPSGTVVLSPTAIQASTHYDPVSKSWLTVAPFGSTGVVLFSALPWLVPVDLPGGIKPVTWTGRFSTDTQGASIKWKWSAAVYSNMSGNPEELGVKAVDGDRFTIYANSDHSGTPENYKSMVVGGAMGGGGSNYTGGRTGDLVVIPTLCDTGALSGSATINGDRGGSVTVGRFKVIVPPGAFSGSANVGIYIPDQSILECNLGILPTTSNHFAVPVTLVTNCGGANVADPTSLLHVWFDESAGIWRPVPGTQVNTANLTIATPLVHFSTYGVARTGKAGW